MATGFEAAKASLIGGRDENQDESELFVDPDAGIALAVVADGMGGHADGALAAQLAIRAAADVWQHRHGLSPDALLERLVENAHRGIREVAGERGIDSRTVIAALWLSPACAVSIHAGDCRVLQYGENGLVKRTKDHSLAQYRVDKGDISESEMATHPDQSRVLTCLGGDEPPDHEITEWSLSDGGNFVVCSDGFWGLLDAGQQKALFDSGNLQEGLDLVLSEGMESAAEDHDNTTVILLGVSTAMSREEPSPTRARGRGMLLPALLLVAAALLAGVLLYRQFFAEEPAGSSADTAALVVDGKDTQSDEPAKEVESTGKQEMPSGESVTPPFKKDVPSVEDIAPPLKPKGPVPFSGYEVQESGGVTKGAEDDISGEATGDASATSPREGGESRAEGTTEAPRRAVEVEGKHELEVGIPVDPDKGVGGTLEEWLHTEQRMPGEIRVRHEPRHRVEVEDSSGGNSVVERLQLVFEGLLLEGEEVIAVVKDGKIEKVVASIPHEIYLPRSEQLDPATALSRAQESAEIMVSRTSEPEPELLILRRVDGSFTRVWNVRVREVDTGRDVWWLVDAHTGEFLVSRPLKMDDSK